MVYHQYMSEPCTYAQLCQPETGAALPPAGMDADIRIPYHKRRYLTLTFCSMDRTLLQMSRNLISYCPYINRNQFIVLLTSTSGIVWINFRYKIVEIAFDNEFRHRRYLSPAAAGLVTTVTWLPRGLAGDRVLTAWSTPAVVTVTWGTEGDAVPPRSYAPWVIRLPSRKWHPVVQPNVAPHCPQVLQNESSAPAPLCHGPDRAPTGMRLITLPIVLIVLTLDVLFRVGIYCNEQTLSPSYIYIYI